MKANNVIFVMGLAIMAMIAVSLYQGVYYMPKKIATIKSEADSVGFKKGFDSGMHKQFMQDSIETKKTSASFEKEKTDLKNQSSHYQKMYKHANDFVIVEKTNWRGEKCRVEVRKTDVKPKEE